MSWFLNKSSDAPCGTKRDQPNNLVNIATLWSTLDEEHPNSGCALPWPWKAIEACRVVCVVRGGSWTHTGSRRGWLSLWIVVEPLWEKKHTCTLINTHKDRSRRWSEGSVLHPPSLSPSRSNRRSNSFTALDLRSTKIKWIKIIFWTSCDSSADLMVPPHSNNSWQ